MKNSFYKLVPYLDSYKEFIADELLKIFEDNNIEFKDCGGNSINKKLIGFKIHHNISHQSYYIDDNFLKENGETYYNTLSVYHTNTKKWFYFFGNLKDDEIYKIESLIENKIIRKLKIKKLLDENKNKI